MFNQANVEMGVAKLIDSLRDGEDLLEMDRESIDVEACEKHVDFCKEILDTILGVDSSKFPQ